MLKKLILLFTVLFSVSAFAANWTSIQGPEGRVQFQTVSNDTMVGMGCSYNGCGFYFEDASCKDSPSQLPVLSNSPNKTGVSPSVCADVKIADRETQHVRVLGIPNVFMEFIGREDVHVAYPSRHGREILQLVFPLKSFDINRMREELKKLPEIVNEGKRI